MARRIFFCIFLLLVALPFQANAARKATDAPRQPDARQTVYTLKQAVERALEANPGVEAKLLAVEKARMDVGVAQSYFWPTVTLNWSKSRLRNSGGVGSAEDYSNMTRTRSMRVSLPLFAGFAHLNNAQKALLSLDVEQARHRQAKLALITDVQLQFLNLLKAREDMKIVQDSKKRIDTQLKAAQAFVNVGMAPYLNVLQNEVELSKVNQQEIRAANAIRNAEVVLNKLLNYEPNDTITYKGELKSFSGVVGYNEAEAIDTSLYNRPDLIVAQKSVAVALKQSHVTAGRYLPSVNLSYDNIPHYNKDYEDVRYSRNDYTRSYWNIGLNFSWEIFSGGSTTFAFLGDRKAADSLRKSYEDAIATARAEVIQALLDIQAARELITATRKGMTAASESYAMANKRYSTNTGTITELLDAQLRLTEAEAGYSQALTEFHSARSRFFYNIGKENNGLD